MQRDGYDHACCFTAAGRPPTRYASAIEVTSIGSGGPSADRLTATASARIEALSFTTREFTIAALDGTTVGPSDARRRAAARGGPPRDRAGIASAREGEDRWPNCRSAPSIVVTIGCHSRLYYAFITSAPSRLDAPSTVTLYAATLSDVAGVRRGRHRARMPTRHGHAHDSCSWMPPNSRWQRARYREARHVLAPADDGTRRREHTRTLAVAAASKTDVRRRPNVGQIAMDGSRIETLEIVDLCRSTTTPSGPLPLVPTARGAEGELGRPCLRRIGDPL